ncbi:unnamed protein product [Ceratitis capitata]|uniref:(Mediterranean fruit fly) hypothetical protein n=1 Tax=Ceratitis capitata TaxID=7213 RepID=A0A811V5K9_CERCA|nr:unnamed protein product [Ceratitis capitata]
MPKRMKAVIDSKGYPNSCMVLLVILVVAGILFNVCCAEDLNSGKDICRLFKDGVLLRKPGYCDAGIECKGFKSTTVLQCSGSTPYYDRATKKCAKSTSDSYCSDPCTTKTSGYVADPKNCQGWYNCNGKTMLKSGLCTANLVFNSTNKMCDYPENSSCTATFDLCDVVPNSTPFLHETQCDSYYECVVQKSKTVLTIKECDTGKYFDVNTGTCLPKSQVICAKYPYPKEVCGNTKLAIRNRFVSDDASCRGYFYCKDLGVGKPDTAPVWGQCPESKFFDSTEEACLPRAHVKCTEDRCDGRKEGYELSSTSGCKNYLLCKDNRTVEEYDCDSGTWFNALEGKCTTDYISYPTCA